mmetsp:Transcript_2327/g.4707  ORF Transcript_2327/g.4707 Transcript_2327/m.4707 type:complete len:209 (+) Transcript_2327:765-1391(+)
MMARSLYCLVAHSISTACEIMVSPPTYDITMPVSVVANPNCSAATSAKMAWNSPDPMPVSSLTVSSDPTPFMWHTRHISRGLRREGGWRRRGRCAWSSSSLCCWTTFRANSQLFGRNLITSAMLSREPPTATHADSCSQSRLIVPPSAGPIANPTPYASPMYPSMRARSTSCVFSATMVRAARTACWRRVGIRLTYSIHIPEAEAVSR